MSSNERQWNDWSNAPGLDFGDKDSMFRRLFERSQDPIWLLDPASGRLAGGNAAAVELLKAGSPEALLQCQSTDLAPERQPDGEPSSARMASMAQKAMDAGAARFEWVARRFDGSLVPLEISLTRIDHARRTLCVAVARDITERRRAEDSLREHRQLLSSVMEHVREAVYRSAADHTLTFVNSAWLKLFGFGSLAEARRYPRERLYARPAERTLLLERLRRDGGFIDFEVEFVRPDGLHFWGSMSSRGVREAGASGFAYYVGSIIDISDRRRMDADLRASEERFRRLFEDSADAMALIDPATGRFLDVNRGLLFKLGYERKEQLIGKPAGAAAPAVQPDGRSSAEAAAATIARALREGSVRTEWWATRADGTQIPVETVLTTVQFGEKLLLLSVSRDISERKRAEAGLKELNTSLEDQVTERTAALQVANQLLRDEIVERQRREKIEHALFRITEAIHQAKDLPQLYPLLHEAVGELMPAKNFFIALHDAATGLHHFVYHRDELDPPPPPRRLGAGLTGHVFRTGQSLLLNRAAMVRGVELADGTYRVEHGTPSAVWLGAPLAADGRILGVVAVQDYHDETAFGESEKRLLTFIAEQAALAIQRKRAEQDLRNSEERHRALFEGTSQGVMIHDDQRIVAVNSAACRLLGYSSPAELVGLHPRDTSAPIQPGGRPADELAARYITEAYERGQVRFEWLARTREGREFPLEVRLTAIHWGSGRILQALLEDITERKRREGVERAMYRISESIHEAETLEQLFPLIHRIVGELMPAENFFLALYDTATGTVEYPYWRDEKDPPPPPRPAPRGLTGRVLQEGRHLLVTAEDFATAEPVSDGHYFRRLDFTAPIGFGTQPLVWLGVPLVVEGRTVGAMALQHYHDPRAYGPEEQRILGFIAEQSALALARKQAETELRRALAREQELGRMKSSFTSLVSHEFRTPLGVIASSAEILRDYFDRLQPDERADHLETIVKHTRRMGGLMEEVLLLSRFDAGRTEFRPEAVEIDSLCRRIADEVLSATNWRCPIAVSLPQPLPVGVADERLLRHVLTNLLVNATKYSDPGSPVELVARREEAQLVIEVRDRGIGIPETDRVWIFEPFQRGSNVGNRPGTGLGLVVVKRCVDLHRGTIQLESAVGRGSTFRVRIAAFASEPPRPSALEPSTPS